MTPEPQNDDRTAKQVDLGITENKLVEIAEQARKKTMNQDSGQIWPDCFEVSKQIVDGLYAFIYEEGIDGIEAEVVKYVINGEYHHYVVEVSDRQTGEKRLVDASFKQFAYEADTPFRVAPIDSISDVITTQPERYIFAESRQSAIKQ